ncbi:DUF4349 domain-containing protein [Kaistella jeonii]|uniref:DUF4349 domain-containing protein n=1 Tax=Kaistella jeonii TaxID=266749 RepID=A0A0C1D681_9FLAO|nr:DUF4349 domain-containing protein [Kaistella jeonii]KIA89335.1 hypothetical protein OA86_06995 [Kaistella jeonii]SFC03084.1 protein of unknown function [Kaistella jeonii]VEI96654.1 Uncharacterised protein [Kaistella jeonii]
MKTPIFYTTISLIVLTTLSSCKKTGSVESADQANAISQTDSTPLSDSISSVANLQVKDKQFIKSADVNMEVKDVYETTIFLEKSLKDLDGFVTSSNLNSNIISEKTFVISDEKAMMVRKFQTENKMQVRIPTVKLGDFLQIINDKKVFLNSRIILAEDVTSNIKLAKLEKERNKNTEKNISKLKLNKDKVKMTDENQSENNYQQVADFDMKDQLEYSTVQIFLTEPEVRVAQIAVSNTQNLENQSNFFYDIKNAVSDGFHLIKQIIIGLFGIWPLIFIGVIAFFFYKRKKALKIVTADKN